MLINLRGVAYQGEIDNITKRCKAAESYFMGVYKHFSEASDPVPLISMLKVWMFSIQLHVY